MESFNYYQHFKIKK